MKRSTLAAIRLGILSVIAVCVHFIVSKIINLFHATSFFLYPLKISENQRFSDIFRGNRKRPMAFLRCCRKTPVVWSELMHLIFFSDWRLCSLGLQEVNKRKFVILSRMQSKQSPCIVKFRIDSDAEESIDEVEQHTCIERNRVKLFDDGGFYHIKSSPLICSAKKLRHEGVKGGNKNYQWYWE